MPEDKIESDHFAVFRLPRKLRIDPKELNREFLRLSRECHPDRFAGLDPSRLAEIQRESARVNDAYRALRDPVLRAEHLLSLMGVDRPEGEPKCPPDLLGEVFALREQLAEGEAGAARERARTLLAEADSSLEALFAEYDEAPEGEPGREILTRVRAALDRRKFVAGLLAEAGTA